MQQQKIDETAVGQKTENNIDISEKIWGEVFNDYENNMANAIYSHVEGHNNKTNIPSAHIEGVNCGGDFKYYTITSK